MKERTILFSGGRRIAPPQDKNGLRAHDGNAKFGDVAHVPGGGPPGKYCRECHFIRHNKNATQWGRCAKAAEQRNISLIAIALIPLRTLACKFFRVRAADDRPWFSIKREQKPAAANIENLEMF